VKAAHFITRRAIIKAAIRHHPVTIERNQTYLSEARVDICISHDRRRYPLDADGAAELNRSGSPSDRDGTRRVGISENALDIVEPSPPSLSQHSQSMADRTVELTVKWRVY